MKRDNNMTTPGGIKIVTVPIVCKNKLTIEGKAPRMITLCKGGTGETVIAVDKIEIPDLWHIAQQLHYHDRQAVLKVWHLAHDLRRGLMEA